MSNPSRRAVIQAAAFVPFQSVRGSAQNSAIKIGLIGAGSRGTYTGSTIAKDPRAKIVAICDVVDEQISKAKTKIGAPDAKAYKNIQDVLASDVDAVMIATPVYLHPDHFEAAVKSGKHIYMEKPAGLDVAGCKRVMKAADGADRKINITFGFQQRYGGVYVKAKQMLDSGAIGKIREVHGEFLKFALQGDEPVPPTPRNDKEKLEQWKLWRATFGEVIVETYVHNLDAINWFLGGHPLKALGTGGRTVEKRGDLLDHLSVTYDYPNNVQMTFIGSQMTPKYFRSNRERYIGSKGFIETAREYWTYNTGAGPVTEKSGHDITVDALHAFVLRIAEGKPENVGVRAAESTLTSILGQMAIDRKREITWDEMMKSA
ncbi:MAG TPA: Gfo/Idh/MocA family oxidoreductase [Bryobacteraceae bacterium]|nr:Gfo/Idh/MocA family oxidoreductase [Bryobacteraceae bacterium]